MTNFEKELENLIKKYSKENASNTPDFLLAEYLSNCLTNYDTIVSKRDAWRRLPNAEDKEAMALIRESAALLKEKA